MGSSDTTYSPGPMHTQVDGNSITTQDGKGLSVSYFGSVYTEMREVSKDNANSFGIGASTPDDLFGGSIGYSSVFNSMFSRGNRNFYGHTSIDYSLWVASVEANPKANSEMAAAIEALPTLHDKETSNDDLNKYFAFFATYGTHYVKTIEYGGKMSIIVEISSQSTESKSMTQQELSLNLQATLQETIKLNASYTPVDTNSTSMQRFNSFVQNKKLNVVGYNIIDMILIHNY